MNQSEQNKNVKAKWLPWLILGIVILSWGVREAIPRIKQYHYLQETREFLRKELETPYGDFISYTHYFGEDGPFVVESCRPIEIEGLLNHIDYILTVKIEGNSMVYVHYRPGVGLITVNLYCNDVNIVGVDRGKEGNPFPGVFSLIPTSGPNKGRVLLDFECDGTFKNITELRAQNNIEDKKE